MFDLGNAATLARELKDRYDPLRAVTLTARLMQKAIFAGRSDDVVFWALVYALYRGHGLNAPTSEQLDAFRAELLRSLKQPSASNGTDMTQAVRRRSTRR